MNKTACQTLKPPEINVKSIVKLIQDCKPGKAPGPDGIRKKNLTIDITQAASCLTMIFHKSLEQGKLPLAWISANVTPIHIAGPADTVNNYRPISLTSIPCKILEHIVLRNLLAKVDQHIYNKQHRFRKGLPCKTLLCATLNDILSSVDKQKSVYAAVLDFSKAFDRVPHALLMKKLSIIEAIDHYLLEWIHSFFQGRF